MTRKLDEPFHEVLFSDLDLHVLLLDSSGRIVYANPRAETALAAQPGGLKALMIDSLFSLRNPQWLVHEVLKCAADGQWSGEAVLNRCDSTECWVHVQACKCPGALNLPDCVLFEFEDITGNVELMTTLMQRNEDLFQRNRELEAVDRVGRLLLADGDLEYRLNTMLKEAATTIGVNCGVVWVKSRDGKELVVRSTYGLGIRAVRSRVRMSVDSVFMSARAVATGRPCVVEDLAVEPSVLHDMIRDRGVKSALSVPMIANGEVIGSVALGETERRRKFSAEEITLVEVIANATASAVSRAILAEDVELSRAYWQRTFDSIEDMMAVVDPSGRIVRANQAIVDRLDSTPAEIVGVHCEEFVSGITAKILARVMSSGHSQDLGIRIVAGEPCAVRAFPLLLSPGIADAVVLSAKIVAEDRRSRDKRAGKTAQRRRPAA